MYFIRLKESFFTLSFFIGVFFSNGVGFADDIEKVNYPIQRFDDWALRCVSKTACEISQPLMVNENGKPVEIVNLAVSRAQDKAQKVKWAMVVLIPLDVQLTSDFGLALDTRKAELLRYRNCNHLGCFVVIPLTPTRLAALKKAAAGAVFFRLLNGQSVKVSFSLKGFSQAFDTFETQHEA